MTALTVVIVLLYAANVAVTVWGWRILPSETRFGIALGVPPSLQGTLAKRTGLVLYIVIGSWFGGLSLLFASSNEGMAWLGAGLMAFFLLIEYLQIRRLGKAGG